MKLIPHRVRAWVAKHRDARQARRRYAGFNYAAGCLLAKGDDAVECLQIQAEGDCGSFYDFDDFDLGILDALRAYAAEAFAGKCEQYHRVLARADN